MALNAEQKMCRAVELGFQKLDNARKARYRFLAQYVGPFYAKNKMGGEAEDKKAAPLNLMFNGVTTLVPNLVSNDPQVQVTTDMLPYRAYGSTFEKAVNHLVQKKIKLRRALRKVIIDSLFCAGIMKVGIGSSDQTLNLDGKTWDIGQIYADRVDLDDFVYDPMARDRDEWSFVGNRFRVPKEDLLESGQFDNAQIEKLCSRYKEGDFKNEVSNLSGDGRVMNEYNSDVREYVDLVEIFVPKEQAIITLPYGNYGGPQKILRAVEYDGPESGPFHMLGYAWVPDNVLPVPPASIWYWLHVLGNRIARKLVKQAERAKRVLAYTPAAMEDARQILDADDGDSIEVEDVNQVKEVNYGGMTEETKEFMGWVETEFSKQAGNIDLLSGTNADAPTATQSEMLASNTNVRINDMQNIVYDFTADVCRDIGFLVHTDPLMDLTLCKRLGTGVEMQVRYTPEMREGDFFDYTFKIKPYSMARQDPNVQLKRLMEFLSQGIPALTQAALQLGPAFKLENAIALVGRRMGIDELDELIDSQLLMQQLVAQMQTQPQPDGKAPGAKPQGDGGAPMGGVRPQQPNPNGYGPVGGVMPDTERKMAQQETAGELQQTY
jgi:hypothetical protein